MAMTRTVDQQPVRIAETQLERVATEGSACHPHVDTLYQSVGPNRGRDLADFVHLLCALHGRYPGLIELALDRCPNSESRQWLAGAAEGFERERLYLVRLASAVGPIPSTPGAAETEATLLSARHAMETLATSERSGCAMGAATALVSDWWPIRRLLDRAAARSSIDSPASSLPDEASVIAAINACAADPVCARALAFGGQQLLLQHRGLFDLLEARLLARGEY